MVIRHNMTAMNANRMLGIDTKSLSAITEKLSSGYAINRAADDAAGLSISEKMRKQIRGLDKGAENIMDGISMLQVADGALTEVHDMLQRMNQLSVQAANGTNSSTDREDIQMEMDALIAEIDRIGETTSFNEIKLFRGKDTKHTAGGSTAGRAVFAKGKPADTSITDYQISADAANGITVNATTYAWADIRNAGGNSLADTLQADTYSFNYNGMTITMEISADDTLDKIAEDMNGLTFKTNAVSDKVKSISTGKTTAISLFYINDEQEYVDLNHAGACKITADQSGITITNTTTNASTYLDFSEVGSGYAKSYEDLMQEGTLNSLTFEFFDTQYTFTLNFDAGWTKNDVISALNGSTYETNFSGNVGDHYTTMSDGTGISMTGFDCNFSKNFYLSNGCDVEKLNIENPFEGHFTSNASEVLLEKDGYSNTFTLDAAGQNTLAAIRAGGCAAGTDIVLKYADGDGNTIQATFQTTAAMSYADLMDYLQKNSFENIGNSIYTASNFVKASDKDYNIDLSKNNAGDLDTGRIGQQIRIQCSANTKDYLLIKIGDMDAETIGVNALSVKTQETATEAIDTVAGAIAKISEQRSLLGAQQNRLEHAYAINQNTSENTQAAESQIRDADMASFIMMHAKDTILVNAAQSMLAQANQQPEYVLNILP